MTGIAAGVEIRAIALKVRFLFATPAEDLSEIAFVRARFQTANLQSNFGCCIALEQLHHDAPKDSEVLRGVVYAYAALIFTEGHVQSPMHLIFYAPVGTYRLSNRECVRREAADVIAALG
jgi:hypothetical protein